MASFFHVGCHQLIPAVVKSTTKKSLHRSFEDFCCRCLLLDVEIELLMLACYCMQPYVGSSYLDSDSTIMYQVHFPLRHLSKLHSSPLFFFFFFFKEKTVRETGLVEMFLPEPQDLSPSPGTQLERENQLQGFSILSQV